MPKVTARIKAKNKQYEIHVDLDEALKVKKGDGDIISAVNCNAVFYDIPVRLAGRFWHDRPI